MIRFISQPRTFTVDGTLFNAFAAPSTGSRENSVWMVSVAPGTEGVTHAVTREEIFIALEGSAQVRSGGQVHELRAGGAMILPAHSAFALGNITDAVFRAVAVLPVGGQAILADGSAISPPWTL